MAINPQNPSDQPSFAPTLDQPLEGEEQFLAIQDRLDRFPQQIDLIVSRARPQPVGRSWAFDFIAQRFIPSPRARGPLATQGMETLEVWIEKCLRTGRGAHPVCPKGYGLITQTLDVIGQQVGIIPADLEERIRDALTFHPRITDVTDFEFSHSDDDDWLGVSFNVLLDDQTVLPINSGVAA